jgi:hypothetical protein
MHFVLKLKKRCESAYTCDWVPQVLETEEVLNIRVDKSTGI